jgi:cobalt-zinc-cadmium efflux system membrane fusion protein
MKRMAAFSILLLSACSREQPASVAHDPPATVSQPKAETELTTVKLSSDAIRRLGIETEAAQIQGAATTRTVGGDVVVPEGRRVQVTAPVAGTLVSASARAGTNVAAGASLFSIAPISAVERDQAAEARRAVESAQAEEQVARQRVQRLELLLKDGATSMRAVEEARAQLEVATAALNSARERLKAIRQTTVGSQGDIMIRAPFAGTILSVSAAEGQTVSASAPLAEIAQVTTLWVKVPLYAGDAEAVDASKPASVTTLGSPRSPRPAVRITAPLTANPTSASVDLFYEVKGSGGPALRPGERVTVQLPLKSTEKGLVISDRAVLYDISGGTWVYEDRGEGTYARRRVEIARQTGNVVVIARGIDPGTKVVTAGAAELFGTEFGAGH